jgi:D-hexose-6-phosphate mutarotase
MTKENTLERFLKYQGENASLDTETLLKKYKQVFNIEFIPMDNLNLKTCIDHLQQKMSYEQVCVETGISTIYDYYYKDKVEENPIDTL